MTQSLICQFLIGLPGSGKSTFARKLQEMIPNAVIVSSDTAREKLYGDASIQGDWTNEVEPEVLRQITEAIASNQPVIYDATNVRRDWRMGILMKIEEKLKEINSPPVYWIARHLQTPIDVCKEWNQKRDCQVPDEVIDSMAEYLKTRITKNYSQREDGKIIEKNKTTEGFKVDTAEGFALVETIPFKEGQQCLPSDETIIETIQVRKIHQSIQNKLNRSQQISEFHQYSCLLDFERLMHLISLIIEYPGIGNLHSTAPELVKKKLGEAITFNSSIDEICAFMNKFKGKIYAENKQAIAIDLDWIVNNSLIGDCLQLSSDINLEKIPFPTNNLRLSLVDYHSDVENFSILIKIIRLIVNQPLLSSEYKNSDINTKGSLETLAEVMAQHDIIHKKSYEYNSSSYIANIRKHIELVLKPYKIIAKVPMKKGYFIGTAIFSKTELEDIYERMILPHKDYVDELIADEIYNKVESRLGNKVIDIQKSNPIRKIGIGSIVNTQSKYLYDKSLARKENIKILEEAITNTKLLKFGYTSNSGKHEHEEHNDFLAYPLQILFHNIAWYIGLAIPQENDQQLLKYERLDRLYYLEENITQDNFDFQESLKDINNLYAWSPGIFLGRTAIEQQNFLMSIPASKLKKYFEFAQIEEENKQKDFKKTLSSFQEKIELCFSDNIFPFILEGRKRYKGIKISKKVFDAISKGIDPKIDSSFAKKSNQLTIIFPQWYIDDYDFLRWILGFGKQVKVLNPPALKDKIRGLASDICSIYE